MLVVSIQPLFCRFENSALPLRHVQQLKVQNIAVSSKDLETLWQRYKVEAVPAGISVSIRVFGK